MKVVLLLSCLVAFAAAYVPCSSPCYSDGCQSNCGQVYPSGCTSGCQQSPYYDQYGSNQLFSSLFSGSYGRNQAMVQNPTPYYDQNAIVGGNTMLRNSYDAYTPIREPYMAGSLGRASNQFSTYGSAGSSGYDAFAAQAGSSGYDAFAAQAGSSGFDAFAAQAGSSGFDAFAPHTSTGFNAFAPHTAYPGFNTFGSQAGEISNFDSTSYTMHPTLADVYKNTRGVKTLKYKNEKSVVKEVEKIEDKGNAEESEEEEDNDD